MLTWAEIDRNAIFHNLQQVKSKADQRGAKVMAIVKDNAYGHGALGVCETAARLPVDVFGVASIEEAVELRDAGIDLPILVISCILPEQAADVIKYDITQTVSDIDVCRELSKHAVRSGKKAKIHVKIDTGLARIGFLYYEAADFVKEICQIPGLEIEGIFTHFASAGSDIGFTNLQLKRFNAVTSALNAMGIRIPIKHVANSTAILDLPDSYLDMVRAGLIVYGAYPSQPPREIELKPALSLKTRVVYVKEVPAGWSISYSGTYKTSKPTMLATIAIGYGHGYSRRMSNQGTALIRGKVAPVRGNVCMDQCICDVTHIPGVSIGDEVVIIGEQGDESITADQIAMMTGTISYDVFCGINSRVPRIFVDK